MPSNHFLPQNTFGAQLKCQDNGPKTFTETEMVPATVTKSGIFGQEVHNNRVNFQ